MKEASMCESIHDIRENIDRIDRHMVDLLAKRAEFIKVASLFKMSKNDVQASERVIKMMVERRNWAVENDIDPDFVEQLFRFIIKYFINSEIMHWEKSSADRLIVSDANESDITDIYYLQKRAFVQEAEKNNQNYSITPLLQNMEQFKNEFKKFVYLKAVSEGMIIGSVRAEEKNGICYIGRVIVEPVFQRKGYGSVLIDAIEKRFPNVIQFELFTAEISFENVNFYKKTGYEIDGRLTSETGIAMVIMRKNRGKA